MFLHVKPIEVLPRYLRGWLARWPHLHARLLESIVNRLPGDAKMLGDLSQRKLVRLIHTGQFGIAELYPSHPASIKPPDSFKVSNLFVAGDCTDGDWMEITSQAKTISPDHRRGNQPPLLY